jgi:hypothetical protein
MILSSTTFNIFIPKLYMYYVIELGKLSDSNPHLRHNFCKSPWPAAMFNFSPWTITFPHTNPGNLAFRWCSITTLRKFDFPPGSTIIFPSTVICHSNTTIEASETRYSFTQYATISKTDQIG